MRLVIVENPHRHDSSSSSFSSQQKMKCSTITIIMPTKSNIFKWTQEHQEFYSFKIQKYPTWAHYTHHWWRKHREWFESWQTKEDPMLTEHKIRSSPKPANHWSDMVHPKQRLRPSAGSTNPRADFANPSPITEVRGRLEDERLSRGLSFIFLMDQVTARQ